MMKLLVHAEIRKAEDTLQPRSLVLRLPGSHARIQVGLDNVLVVIKPPSHRRTSRTEHRRRKIEHNRRRGTNANLDWSPDRWKDSHRAESWRGGDGKFSQSPPGGGPET